jgi:hypothetical protein
MKNILRLLNWTPVGFAVTIVLNIFLVIVTGANLTVPIWLVFVCSVLIAAFFWDIEKKYLILEKYYGISFPIQFLYFSAFLPVVALLSILLK